MQEPTRLTELLARMWIECDPNRDDPSLADEIQSESIVSGGVGSIPDEGITTTITRNPLAGKPAWYWLIPRAEATIAYLAKHGLEIREIGK